MYINTVVSVFDDGNTNPMINTHVITTSDKEANNKFAVLVANAVGEGWVKASTTDAIQANFVKGSPRRTLSIRKEAASFSFNFDAKR